MTRVPGTANRIDSEGTVVNEADIFQAQIGAFGGNYANDTAAHTPETGYVFIAVQVIEEAVIAAYAPAFEGNTIVGETFAAGTVIFGRFTSITLTSGKILAYQGI